MEKTPFYLEIAEHIRQDILQGNLQPGDELPTVREMSGRMQCAPGTVQRAYHELARQGLVVARPGAGTRVAPQVTQPQNRALQRATLINQAEAFLLRALAAGHAVEEISQAVQLALDRWRATPPDTTTIHAEPLRFVGSHDPALTLLCKRLETAGYAAPKLSFTGSLGGLIALARHEADLAGCHLWDQATNTYNRPFVQRLMPGRRVALVRLASRKLGILVPCGNPLGITQLTDLGRPGVQIINRQEGAGTRVWLEAHLQAAHIVPTSIQGYGHEALTHTELASAISCGQADAGVGIETAARLYGLDFVPLTTEHYDLAIPAECWEHPDIQALVAMLADPATGQAIAQHSGHDTTTTGQIDWITPNAA